MFDTANHSGNAASLHSAGAIVSVANPEDPRNPIMYMAGNQDISQGVVHLDMTSDSRLKLAAQQEPKAHSPQANNKYAALNALSKPGQGAAAMQRNGINKYAALQANRPAMAQTENRAALRVVKAPEPKAAPQPKVAMAQPVAAAPTVSMSVGQLHMKKEQKPELVASNDTPVSSATRPTGGFYRRHNQLVQNMACAFG